MSETQTLPVLPLRNMVLFPAVTTPIRAGRPATMRAIQEAIGRPDRLIYAVLQTEDSVEVDPDRLHTVGTIARIDQVQKVGTNLQLLVTGVKRGVAIRVERKDGHLEAIVRSAEDMFPPQIDDPSFMALQRELTDRATELAEKAGLPEEIIQSALEAVDDAGELADLVVSYLELDTPLKQELLANLSVEERLRQVLLQVQKQLNVVSAQEDIQSKVREELGDRQREMLLREQLKAIQEELGQADEANELDELKQKLDELELGEEARKEVDREYDRLQRMNRESMEYQVVRSFLETVAELPWNQRTSDDLDLEEAKDILEQDHYGLDDVKDRVLEFLAVKKLHQERDAMRGEVEDAESDEQPGNEDDKAVAPILLFGGPPGVGKTSIAKSIARAMGRKYVRISLGGARDEADIRGHRKTYVGAMPGRIIQGMRQAGSKNPVFLLDEVDKLGASFQGDPAAALLEVLDPAQNDSFVDHYLGLPFDLSEVLFIATANFLQNIPGPLLDRMEVVEFSGYTEGEKLEIAKRYLLPRQIRRHALDVERLAVSDEALQHLISHYTREAGVRQLERTLGKLARKAARRIATGEAESIEVGIDEVRDLLGRPRARPEKAADEDQIGIATGMYYTPAGGDIMFVEATTMRGRGELVLTGQLGDVMKESARAAWSYARSHATDLDINEEMFERDVHIHVPAGAIPKDGPSAGVTMATALVSSLSGRPSRHEVAMTGEVTLSGRVLPIGGVKEKVLGAVRAGITEVVLPKENEADLEDLPQEIVDQLTVHAVEELGEVLTVAIPSGNFQRPAQVSAADENAATLEGDLGSN